MTTFNEVVGIDDVLRWSPGMEEYVRRAARTWCYRLGIRGEDIRDLEQDAVMIAWERVGNGKVRYKEGLWFLARNVVLDFRAKRARIPTTELEEMTARDVSNPLDKLVIEDIEREFPELVMLAAARADGYEWDLIAESLGVSCGTLRVRFSRMVKKAGEHFGEEIWDVFQRSQ